MNSIDAAYYSPQGQHWVKCISKTVYVYVHPAELELGRLSGLKLDKDTMLGFQKAGSHDFQRHLRKAEQ